jgi:alkylated DNA repair dioxygenase AlkB
MIRTFTPVGLAIVVKAAQPNLFGDAPDLPEGMRYAEEVISAGLEERLVAFIKTLPLTPFEFVGGLKGNRKVISFGFRYDWGAHEMQEADAIPQLLLDLREEIAPFAGIASERLQQVLVTEYASGAGIGWHKDRPQFDEVVGVSLLAPCNFRLRRKVGEKWERKSFTAQPRSAYLLSGASRQGWEHSIPAVKALRYSVTFRSFR